ncbi:Type 1 glutamine amidotransferase-like domain-containing protein [Actinomadura rupiterrae]|uniref:Type 1 glutamine amidotransferase-like domain-containing protein n=1 Tax=Actinomadura rupiterrae TaxID=559627 RepID=UPI0020A3603B|nr:Type 1 glutamine amidotransferase-like domain-containing protein [Actinomadura rupiterrae]MCP2339421.1 dipeptidase E [Actinomadura rupiterrae]
MPQRLFLGSAGLGALPSWLDGLPGEPRRALLIPTAATPLPSAPYVQVADDLLRAEGLEVERLDLEHASRQDVRQALDRAQVVFVCGGFAMFLLEHAQRSGFAQLAAEAVREGRLAYAGISAGAALAGPDLRTFEDLDDPGRPDGTAGMGLVPFIVLAHRNRGRAERHDRLAADASGRFVSINDDQVITVVGDRWSLESSPTHSATGRS